MGEYSWKFNTCKTGMEERSHSKYCYHKCVEGEGYEGGKSRQTPEKSVSILAACEYVAFQDHWKLKDMINGP